VIFSSNIIKIPKSSRGGALKKVKEKQKGKIGRKIKAPRVYSNKGKVNILRKTLQLQKSFLM
jgi:hypothetical protein